MATCDFDDNPVHDTHGGELFLCRDHWDVMFTAFKAGVDPYTWWDAENVRLAGGHHA